MKAADLDSHMRRVGEWVDWERSCDGFKFGSPDIEVRSIAVAWQSSLANLREAGRLGCNLFVTHEPTFYAAGRDDHPGALETEPGSGKRRFLEESGITVYRCHDVWDAMPDIGILDSWSEGLALEKPPIASKKFYSVHRFNGTVRDLALQVKERTAEVGQPAVEVMGDMSRQIRSVAVGTGAINSISEMREMGGDAAIVTDDGFNFWGGGLWAADLGFPLIVVNHAASEEWGIRNLAAYIAGVFPELEVRHIPQGCLFTLV